MEPPAGPSWWTSGRHGTLSPWSQSIVYGILTVTKHFDMEMGDGEVGEYVKKIGGGHPQRNCIRELRNKMEDPTWYPGKACG